MSKYIFIDSKLRREEEDKLISLGYKLIKIPKSNNVYEEVSSHSDIFVSKVGNTIVIERDMYDKLEKSQPNFNMLIAENEYKKKFKIIKSSENLKDSYPNDIKLNVCIIGRFAIHNFKYTDRVLLEEINKQGYEKINIKQGYSNCSIAVVDEKSCIVSDIKIKEELEKYGIEVMYIKNTLENIKLLSKEEFSKMNGLIGGCMSRAKNSFIVFGDLDLIDPEKKIRRFIESKNVKLVEFKEKDIIDYGGTVLVDI